MSLPGYGRMAQILSRRKGKANMRALERAIPELIGGIPGRVVGRPLHFVSFSGKRTLTEQIYSILSVYYNLGTPLSWTVYSDKTHGEEDIALLQRIPNMTVIPWDGALKVRYKELADFAKKFPVWGHRLEAYMNHPIEGTTIFLDSDILFYPSFNQHLETVSRNNWYIADTGSHFDAYYDTIATRHAGAPYINAGFLIFNSRPNWELILDYIGNRPDGGSSWEHFSDQAAMHHMMRSDPSGRALDPNYFILSCTDSFRIGIDYPTDRIALRHFVGPVRHKMWQTSWQKVLLKH